MTKFIYKFIVFFIPIIFFSYIIDYIVSKKIRESGIGDFSVWEDIYKGKINSDIVIYGSSRALNHIDPIILENKFNTTSYNLGMAGQHVWLQNLRHLEFLKFNKIPKVVIYSLDDLFFSNPEGIYQPDQFSPYLFWPEHKEIKEQMSVFKFPHFTFYDYNFPLIRYIDSFYAKKIFEIGNNFCNSFFNKFYSKINEKNTKDTEKLLSINEDVFKIPDGRIKGFLPIDSHWNNDLEKALFSEENIEVSINKKGILLFEKIINELKSKNIYIVLVYTPEYIEGQKFVKNRNQVIKIYKDISSKYNIPFFNYSEDSMSFNKSYFFNSLHLNANGAELFSKKLANDLYPILSKVLNKH